MSSSAEPSPTASSEQSDQRNPTTSSNLYLVTFLATLFLLLFVSCAIVMRSYVLRRRFQREQDDQLAAGRFLAPRTQGSKRKRFGAKPRLFDTWLADGGVTWDHIKPISAQPVFVKRRYRDGRVPKDGVVISGAPQQPPTIVQPPAPRPTAIRRFFSRTRPTYPVSQETDDTEALVDAEAIATTTDIPNPAITYKVRVEMLQVSVLIAMPCQNRSIKKGKALDPITNDIETEDEDDDEDAPLPNLVFGVTRVNYRQPKSQKTTDTNNTSQQKPQMPIVPEEEL
ncbi:hypothetical protein JR316_0007044 [Psilocybe cubensis]|uniref:Uncharacterized protein n=2 Tax=Psilocybe cubensis TaxID=181762 RepID=A0ACB8GXY0_PSICU|nr:hypothetical protein JR316_0007044 [Psilocybe cubensis]KAH9480444.1 hypothetical protein JR316_0007044 [Psilocybe cubensis]